MSDPDLLLNLALDELQGEKLVDDSGGHRNAINHGGALVEDKVFGRCLELKGGSDSYVQLSSMNESMGHSHALTVMLWIKPAVNKLERPHRFHSTTEVPKNCVLELAHLYEKQTQVLGFSFFKVSDRELVASVFRGDFVMGSSTHYHLDDQRLQSVTSGWIHLTFVRDAQGQQFYLNGVPFSTYQAKALRSGLPGHNPLQPPAASSQWMFPPGIERGRPDLSLLGKSQIGVKEIGEPFAGCVAHLRVYKRALTHEEINWHINGDRTVQYRYRITHPIDFSLENRDADPTLFMDGHPEGQNMFLRVNNVTGGVVQLAPPQGIEPAASDDDARTSWFARNCHFEIAFRPGTLEVGSILKVTTATLNSAWRIAGKTWKKPDDCDSLYLLCTDAKLPDGGLTLELAHVRPDSRYGTRTTLVDFRYKNLKSGSLETISGSVQQNLDLVNHLGRRNIPLHVGFAGSNLVLNNSDKPTELRLRVTNVLPRTDVYDDRQKTGASGVMRFGDKSELLLSFDEGSETWALNEHEKLKDIVVYYAKGHATKESPFVTPGKPAQRWQWCIPLKDLFLEPEEHLEILLVNVKAAGSDGHSNLYLDYRDVPGYWNGRFTSVIEKGPLIYREGRVGIGVVAPEVELEVKGTLKVDSLIVNNRPVMRSFELERGWKPKDASVAPRYFRDSQGMIHLTGHCIYTVPAKDAYEPSPEWSFRDAFVTKKQGPFTLRDDCLPLADHELRFPCHVRCFLTGYHRFWDALHIRGSAVYSPLDYALPPNDPSPLVIVEIYLDGISYRAKS